MTDEIDDIRKQVRERVDEEAATLPPQEDESPITSKFIRDCLHSNELGDGALYAATFRDRFLYCKNTQEWFEWVGHCWQRDIMNHSLAAVEEVVDHYLAEYGRVSEDLASQTKEGLDLKSDAAQRMQGLQESLLKRISRLRADKGRTACLKFAHTISHPLAIKGEEFDDRPLLFPCANGVIDLETGLIRPGRPGDHLSLASPVEFISIDTPAPLWERSLLEIFGGDSRKPPGDPKNESSEEMVAFIQRLIGYAMTGLQTEKLFAVLYGKTGWNGRSLITETISHVMGAMAGPIPSEMLLSQKFAKNASGPSPDVVGLKGLRMAFASEIDEGQRFSAAKIKWLTGKVQLTGRSPHDKYSTVFYPTHTLFVETNIQPSAPPSDKSFWERMHLIPFDISFVKRDPREAYERPAILDLDQKVLAEAPGILAWMVRGCLLYQRDGIKPPRVVTDATEVYRRGEDLLADFIDECCIVEPGARVKASVIFARYKEWYGENIGKTDKISGTWFGKQLHQKFKRDKSNGCNVYFGIDVAASQGGSAGKTDEIPI